jgi:hypothetical protein
MTNKNIFGLKFLAELNSNFFSEFLRTEKDAAPPKPSE